MSATTFGRVVWGALVAVWLTVVVAGLVWVARYDNAPGAAGSAPARWPAGSRLGHEASRPTLIMFAHPLCDCTRASLAELAELMAESSESPHTDIVFVDPGGLPPGWEHGVTVLAAHAISGAQIEVDVAGVEAKRFGARTSGQALLYSPDGRLLFHGGTTRARGHVGTNVGRTSILALLRHTTPADTETPVFGCSLFGPTDRPNFSR